MRLKNLLVESKNYYDYKLYGSPEIDGKKIHVKYVFQSEKTDYEVLLRKSVTLDDNKDYIFWISAAYQDVWSDTARMLTGEGKARKIITTFFEIIKDFIDRFWNELDEEFVGVRISSVGKNDEMKSKRHRVYKYFADKTFPSKKIEEDDHEIFIWIDEKEK